jgi:hypothetical protein
MVDFAKVERLMKTPTSDLVGLDVSQWNESFSGIASDDLRLLSNSLIRLSVQAARMAAYIDARGGENQRDLGHLQGVIAQNEMAAKVRAIFGFQQAKDDLDF